MFISTPLCDSFQFVVPKWSNKALLHISFPQIKWLSLKFHIFVTSYEYFFDKSLCACGISCIDIHEIGSWYFWGYVNSRTFGRDISIVKSIFLCCSFNKTLAYQGHLLLTWINFNSSMDKQLHPSYSVGWECLSIPNLPRCSRLRLGMDK